MACGVSSAKAFLGDEGNNRIIVALLLGLAAFGPFISTYFTRQQAARAFPSGKIQIVCQKESYSEGKSTWLMDLESSRRPALRRDEFDQPVIRLIEGRVSEVLSLDRGGLTSPGGIGIELFQGQIRIRPGIINFGSRSLFRVVTAGTPSSIEEPWRKTGQIADTDINIAYRNLPAGPIKGPPFLGSPPSMPAHPPIYQQPLPSLERAQEEQQHTREPLFLDACNSLSGSGYREFFISDPQWLREALALHGAEVLFERSQGGILAPADWAKQGLRLKERIRSLADPEGVILLFGDSIGITVDHEVQTALAMADSLAEFLAPAAQAKGWRVFSGQIATKDGLLPTTRASWRTSTNIEDPSGQDRSGNVVYVFFLGCETAPFQNRDRGT